MSIHTGAFDMAGRTLVEVACRECGWSNDGELVLVDRYALDWPPIPRGDGRHFLELYLESSLGPDARVMWCAQCGRELQVEDVVEVEA